MSLVLFLLCSGLFHSTFSSHRLRVFSMNTTVVMENFLSQCKQKNESLATLFDEEDANVLHNFAAKLPEERQSISIWLGLHMGRNITWSDGVPLTFSNSSANVTNGGQRCEAIDKDTWRDFNCTERKPFMCYMGNDYTLIENEKNWCQALQYCRKYFTDLVSISNDDQNAKVIEKGNNTCFWIGLLHDKWMWRDKSCSSFRNWKPSKEPESFCTVYSRSEEIVKMFDCNNDASSLCSKGTMRIKVIEKNYTWEQAFDYCTIHHTRLLWIEHANDQKAVEQWLNYTEVAGPFWIGLRQSRVFGFWIWSSDRTVTYSNWKNDKQPEMPLSNHCGVIKKDYRWSDENCLLPLYFLCEEEITFMDK